MDNKDGLQRAPKPPPAPGLQDHGLVAVGTAAKEKGSDNAKVSATATDRPKTDPNFL
jgi:hypothetical protein